MTKNDIKKALLSAGIDDAGAEATLIIDELFALPAAAQAAAPERDYDSAELRELLSRRLAREPLAYIIGKKEFCTEVYSLNSDTLIPRPETELTVEYAAKNLPRGGKVLDLCTGSGCIAVSLSVRRRDLAVSACDISDGALEAAVGNAAANGAEVAFYKGDALTENVFRGVYDAIISNPPYIKSDVVGSLSPELAFEPKLALDGGADGLLFYRAICKNAKSHLSRDGVIIFEIGFDEAAEITAFAAADGYSAEVIKDYSCNDRIIVLRSASWRKE